MWSSLIIFLLCSRRNSCLLFGTVIGTFLRALDVVDTCLDLFRVYRVLWFPQNS